MDYLSDRLFLIEELTSQNIREHNYHYFNSNVVYIEIKNLMFNSARKMSWKSRQWQEISGRSEIKQLTHNLIMVLHLFHRFISHSGFSGFGDEKQTWKKLSKHICTSLSCFTSYPASVNNISPHTAWCNRSGTLQNTSAKKSKNCKTKR